MNNNGKEFYLLLSYNILIFSFHDSGCFSWPSTALVVFKEDLLPLVLGHFGGIGNSFCTNE